MLEDTFGDILGKARWGRGMTIDRLAEESRIPGKRVRELEAGEAPRIEEVLALAQRLGLDGERLAAVAEERWQPKPSPPWTETCVRPIQGFIGSYPVWGYLLFDLERGDAILIDTASDPQAVLSALKDEGLRLSVILLTHAHPDHIGGLEEIRRATGAEAYLHPEEGITLGHPPGREIRPVEEGKQFQFGAWTLRPLSTPGHTPGGTSYYVEKEEEKMAFVGDALFAGSVGRSRSPQSYTVLLEGIRKKILSLSPGTVLFPGHGPASTVGEETTHNPFFPAPL